MTSTGTLAASPPVAAPASTAHRYRADVDGIRGIAVASVIVFHAWPELLPGGFVGVDVFFVISGYLITGLIVAELGDRGFSWRQFYRRRAARLLPALLFTLALTTLFAFLSYDSRGLDSYGKQLFFSAFGFANIHFSRGFDYFAADTADLPLLHLWSLGVEEQFYFVWPLLLVALLRAGALVAVAATLGLLVLSLALSVAALPASPLPTYFLPQYRAFELLIGAIVAIVQQSALTGHGAALDGGADEPALTNPLSRVAGVLGATLILVPMIHYDESTPFPGWAALVPCVGTALLLVSERSPVHRALAARALVGIGLISYPLYLLHLPIIAALHTAELGEHPALVLIVCTGLGGALAWVVYRFLERPVRRNVRSGSASANRLLLAMLAGLVLLAALGGVLARTGGLPERLALLNPFALEIERLSRRVFFDEHASGVSLGADGEGGVLVVGDSIAQDLVVPLLETRGLDRSSVDLVTLGGCVLLAGVEFEATTTGEKCATTREALYALDRRWDTVYLTQRWTGYERRVRNLSDHADDPIAAWTPFVDATVAHFAERARRIVIFGAHVEVHGTGALRADLLLTPERYARRLDDLAVTNAAALARSRTAFERWAEHPQVDVVHTSDVWRTPDDRWRLHDGERAWFGDEAHTTAPSVRHVAARLEELLNDGPER